MTKIKPIPYYGGKSGFGKADWICSLLPWNYESLYVETHGGSGGVLCARDPVKKEIYNDLDSRVTNFHEVLQESPEEIAWKIQHVPHSREYFEKSQKVLLDNSSSKMDRAVAFYTIATQASSQNLNTKNRKMLTWIKRFSLTGGMSNGRWDFDRVITLAARFHQVYIENTDAVDLLERIQDYDYAVIYCDPPYITANTTPYLYGDVDVVQLTIALKSQKGMVAVSGINDEWDHLDWERHEKKSQVSQRPGQKNLKAREITEVLWTNY